MSIWEKSSFGKLTTPLVTALILLMIDRKAYHFAKFRALTQGATQLELEVASAFPNGDDFRYDFDLSPVLSAVLQQYDPADAERPTLDAIIDFAKKALTAPLDVDWSQRKRELRGRSPLFQEVIDFFQNAGSTEGARLGAFYDFLDSPDALQTWTPIQWAAYVDRKNEFDLLIKNGIPRQLLKLTPSRRNVLHQAAESGTQDILTYVLEGQLHLQGVDINLPDIWDETPLHVAAGRSSKSAALLLDYGADINARQSDGQVPLHYTKLLSGEDRLDCIKHFLKRENPPVNVRDVEGKSPIFYLLDSPDCVKLLIDRGADTGISDIEGKTLLHHACANDYPETLELIIKRFPRGLEARADKGGCTPLQICFQNQRVLCARILLRETMVAQAKDKNGWSLIHHAVRMGDETVLRQVIALQDTDIRARTNDGQSVFDIARSMGTLYTIIGDILRKAMHMSAEGLEELDCDKPSS
jgi:ankyrin repeat protein